MPTIAPPDTAHPIHSRAAHRRQDRLRPRPLRPKPRAETTQNAMTSAHEFSFSKLAEPGEIKLEDFAGKAVLVVNVASACGFTSQYRDLESLYEAFRNKGLVIVGVPSNDFGAQEAGSEQEIRKFCDATYHVAFPMTGKVDIVSPQKRHPFYAWIANELGESALPRWNFHKFLIGKDGGLVEAFPAKAAPLGPQMLDAIKQALSA